MRDVYLVTWPEKLTPERLKALGIEGESPEEATACAVVPKADAIAFAREQKGARVFHLGPEVPVPDEAPDRSVRKHGAKAETPKPDAPSETPEEAAGG